MTRSSCRGSSCTALNGRGRNRTQRTTAAETRRMLAAKWVGECRGPATPIAQRPARLATRTPGADRGLGRGSSRPPKWGKAGEAGHDERQAETGRPSPSTPAWPRFLEPATTSTLPPALALRASARRSVVARVSSVRHSDGSERAAPTKNTTEPPKSLPQPTRSDQPDDDIDKATPRSSTSPRNTRREVVRSPNSAHGPKIVAVGRSSRVVELPGVQRPVDGEVLRDLFPARPAQGCSGSVRGTACRQ